MRDLAGRVAVVTGAASGIGRAMCERFLAEGMRVVLADVEEKALAETAGELAGTTAPPASGNPLERVGAGGDVAAVVTDVADAGAVRRLADVAYERFGAVHVLCNNAGIGPAGGGAMWEIEPGDWEWAWAVNVRGVINGINAFVPRMLASGEPGHIVNTSSGNGGVAPLPGQPVYATTKAAVVTLTECLYGQLAGTGVTASVLFPGPHMLRTGIWTAERNRPREFAGAAPRRVRSVEEIEEAMRAAGIEPRFTPVEEVADHVVRAIRDERFWILPESPRTDATVRARAESMLARSDPGYLSPPL
ncbi:SDR family NAD(P)-dependent oxidoreductase [Bailinhaonella thermotolerans]|uniref:SDR family NAD(P)-dependent oxidoreductase n=1 Tax=Bailinhaonella thermotolerans TaxID=1070861 RepID=A0A3A4A6D8_9ACTN|nr:SDR family NAD(P)-dependent oxidoreductase [Bailinhaonella thermotolerans]RJL24135.1 SDR family NAD(P)-dependent oxidoreductase [Bailinhaonella thermotolerans]